MLYQVLTLQSKGRRLDKDTQLRKDNGTKPKSAVRDLAALRKHCVHACNIDFPLSLLLGSCLLWGTKHYSLFVRFVVRDLPLSLHYSHRLCDSLPLSFLGFACPSQHAFWFVSVCETGYCYCSYANCWQHTAASSAKHPQSVAVITTQDIDLFLG